MKNICLIIPPSVFLLDERVFMSLGILKIAAVLEKSNYNVDVLDLSGIENFEEAITDYVKEYQATVYGLTATTPQMPAVNKLVKKIRKEKPDSKIIFGGPHVTLLNAAYRNEHKRAINGRASRSLRDLLAMFDVVVAGDGEKAIFEALKPGAKGLIDADNPNSPFFLRNDEIISVFPARYLIDVNSYHYYVDGERALSLIAQLGCPFNCGFCGGRKAPSLRRIRVRPIENVVEEIRLLHQTYGVKGFMFYDDELNINRQLMIDLMNSLTLLQEELGIDFKLRGFVRSDLFDDEQAKAMYRAGFRWILAGFESGSPRILKNMNKKITREQNTRCVEIARRYGLKVKALMSIGHPGESEETIMETHDWLLKVKPNDFDITIITVYPGSAYYDEAVPCPTKPGIWVYTYAGDRLYSEEVDYREVADYYKGDPEGGYKSFVHTDYLDPSRIVELRDFAENDVRNKLGIPFNPAAVPRHYEHSLGTLPSYILKKNDFK